jgi:TorA maturation chaperone TorD
MTQETAISVEVEAFTGLNLNQEINSAEGHEEQLYRASAYSLLASLLRCSPDQSMLDRLSGLESTDQKEGDDLLISMSTLALFSQQHNTSDIEQEFHDLFIGLGKGEVVPYGSWYLTGFLMEKPLSDLRDDLIRLGFERNTNIVEPEDHAAALCEVISIMITESSDLKVQQKFFETHMVNWFDSFFDDLSEAQSSVYYKAVARFGSAFIAFEKQYFSMAI